MFTVSVTIVFHVAMLRTKINIKENVDISEYIQLKTFLKRKLIAYKPKKSKTLTAVDIRSNIHKKD